MFKIFRFKEEEPKIVVWEINDEHHDKLSIDVLNKIYTEAEIRHNEIIDNLTLLKGRAYRLLSVFISLLSILITLYFGDYLEVELTYKESLTYLYLINIIMIAYVIAQLVRIVFPNYIMVKGREPKIMDYEGLATMSCEKQNIIYLFTSISIIQEKIEYNEKVLGKKTQNFENIIFVSTVLFIFTLILQLLLKSF